MEKQINYSANCTRIVKTDKNVGYKEYPEPDIYQRTFSRIQDIATYRADRNHHNPLWFIQKVVNW